MARRSLSRRGRNRRARLAVTMLCGLGMTALAAGDAAWAEPPPWVTSPGQRAGAAAPQLAYRLPAGLRDGRCRPEMFDPSGVGGLVGAALSGRFAKEFTKDRGRLAATAIGVLVAAATGRPAGSDIAAPEEICFTQGFEHVPDRETIVWLDPKEGVHYAVTPIRTVKAADGRYCREYEARATVNGQAAGTYGTACRLTDGRWELIN